MQCQKYESEPKQAEHVNKKFVAEQREFSTLTGKFG